MRRDVVENKRHAITIDTNPKQVISIIVLFLAMFVFPIQLYNLYQNGELSNISKQTRVLGTSTDTTTATEDKFLGIDTRIFTSESFGRILVYVGVALSVITFVLLLYLILKPKNTLNHRKNS